MNEFPAAMTRQVTLGAACRALSIALFVVQAIGSVGQPSRRASLA
jgi:hypothetical protein